MIEKLITGVIKESQNIHVLLSLQQNKKVKNNFRNYKVHSRQKGIRYVWNIQLYHQCVRFDVNADEYRNALQIEWYMFDLKKMLLCMQVSIIMD